MPKIDLPRLAGMVFNTPLMMDKKRLDTALAVLGPRILDGLEVPPDSLAPNAEDERTRRMASSGALRFYSGGGYLAEYGIGVLPILGTLVRRASWLDAACGMMSYSMIVDAATEILADGQTRGLMLEIDSPGGEAGGTFDAVTAIRSMAEAAGKPVWSHANELAASAGYALYCAANTGGMWLSRTAEVGSIGVVAAHVDVSAADEMAGHRWEYITFGAKKVDGNPHEPLSDGARADIQADVDDLGEAFVELVSLNRGLDADEIRATEAGIFRGVKAIEAGLADKLGTFDEAMQAFAEHIDETQTEGRTMASLQQVRTQLMAPKPNAKPNAGSTSAAAIVAATEGDKNKAKPAGAEASEAAEDDEEDMPEEGKGKSKSGKAKATEDEEDDSPDAAAAETARCAELAGIAKQAARLGVDFDLSAAITNKVSADSARKSVMAKAAEADDAETVTTVAPPERQASGNKANVRAAFARGLKRGARRK